MAIGLSNVNNRKVKRQATEPKPATIAAEPRTSKEAWSTRGLAREGRSVERERKVASGDLNTLWLDWTTCVTGTETSSRLMRTVRRMLDLENFLFEFFVHELQIPARAKKRILGIRSRSAQLLQIRKLLVP